MLAKITAATSVLILAPTAAPAVAQPPSDSSEAMKRYQELGVQVSEADEDLLGAQADLRNAQVIRDQANGDLAATNQALDRARSTEEQFRGRVDEVTAASLRGSQYAKLSSVMATGSSQEFLDRMSALSMLAASDNAALNQYSTATAEAARAQTTAADAQKRAQESTDAAQRALDEVSRRKADLDGQLEQLRRAMNQLSSAEKKTLNSVQDNGSYLGPPGAANTALQAALSKRGSEYEWGKTGPGEFDCSGLTSWAYKQAGITLPRTSRQQYTVGRAVSFNELRPGDLVFFDDGTGDPSAIHHVGMFAGPGKMIDAPTEGQLVDVRSVKGDGHYIGARRIVG
jgi:peptidoglycan DL-endopeptidase CwlO